MKRIIIVITTVLVSLTIYAQDPAKTIAKNVAEPCNATGKPNSGRWVDDTRTVSKSSNTSSSYTTTRNNNSGSYSVGGNVGGSVNSVGVLSGNAGISGSYNSGSKSASTTTSNQTNSNSSTTVNQRCVPWND